MKNIIKYLAFVSLIALAIFITNPYKPTRRLRHHRAAMAQPKTRNRREPRSTADWDSSLPLAPDTAD